MCFLRVVMSLSDANAFHLFCLLFRLVGKEMGLHKREYLVEELGF